MSLFNEFDDDDDEYAIVDLDSDEDDIQRFNNIPYFLYLIIIN